jgi:hypothetical protein
MSDAAQHYQGLVTMFASYEGVAAGQMFGKPCLKIAGKAFVAQHRETVVFKLTGSAHALALAEENAILWDPSGKGRPMKEWVALPVASQKKFKKLAAAAMEYVHGTAA